MENYRAREKHGEHKRSVTGEETLLTRKNRGSLVRVFEKEKRKTGKKTRFTRLMQYFSLI